MNLLLSLFSALLLGVPVYSNCPGNGVRLADERAVIVGHQCNTCQDLPRLDCLNTDVCEWTHSHGCMAAETVGVGLKYIAGAAEEYLVQDLLHGIDNCTRNYDEQSCYSSGRCQWNMKSFLAPQTSNCSISDDEFFTILLGFGFQFPEEQLQPWLSSGRLCRSTPYGSCSTVNGDLSNIPQGKFLCESNMEEEDGEVLSQSCQVTDPVFPLLASTPALINDPYADYLRADAFCKAGSTETCATISDWCMWEYGECKVNETKRDTFRANNPTSHDARRDELNQLCESMLNETACSYAHRMCYWEEDDESPNGGNCEVDDFAWYIDVSGGADWVKDFMGDFMRCERENDNAVDCIADPKCEWTSELNDGSEGMCLAHFSNAFPYAVPGYDQCMQEFANLLHHLQGCFVNINSDDCADSTHHPGYDCAWECGICVPPQSYFDTLQCNVPCDTPSPTQSPTSPTISLTASPTMSPTMSPTALGETQSPTGLLSSAFYSYPSAWGTILLLIAMFY